MANSVNYQHFKTLLNAYEKAYPEKIKNAWQNAVAEIGQLSQNDRNKILSREATLKKYKADPNQKELDCKRQQKFRSNQKRRLIEIEKQAGEKLSKQSRD